MGYRDSYTFMLLLTIRNNYNFVHTYFFDRNTQIAFLVTFHRNQETFPWRIIAFKYYWCFNIQLTDSIKWNSSYTGYTIWFSWKSFQAITLQVQIISQWFDCIKYKDWLQCGGGSKCQCHNTTVSWDQPHTTTLALACNHGGWCGTWWWRWTLVYHQYNIKLWIRPMRQGVGLVYQNPGWIYTHP